MIEARYAAVAGTALTGSVERAGSVIVTGAAGGLGGAVAERLLSYGWRVVASTSKPDQRLPDGVVRVVADLMVPAAVAELVAVADHPEAPLRAVVNLVGGYAGGSRVHETPIEDFEAQLRLNLRPTYLVTAAALPYLIGVGGGSVVCVSSRAAVRPFPGAAGYITAKAALLAFVDALAVEYREERVRVNAVLPSVIDTPGNRTAQPNADFGRWVTPAQVAEVICALVSPTSAATSGAHIPVYGLA